jgi:hypothetical protein
MVKVCLSLVVVVHAAIVKAATTRMIAFFIVYGFSLCKKSISKWNKKGK